MVSNDITDWYQALTAPGVIPNDRAETAKDEVLQSVSAEVVVELAALLCAYSLPADCIATAVRPI